MNSIFAKLKKLRGRSLDELRVRSTQMLHAQAERRGWSPQARLPTDTELLANLDYTQITSRACDDLLEHFRTRRAPRFFAGFDDTRRTLDYLKQHSDPQTIRRTIECAHGIRAGRFDLLGLHDLDFGAPPDWHLEPIADLRAPLHHWSRIAYLDPQVAGDKKITWEVNRHGYFATLGRAYLYTEDETHAETFATHLASWMDANPPKQGINWASSLEVSFRAIAWLWAFHFFRDSAHLTSALFARTLKFLLIHARHLETYLSTYFSPNTHLSGEALGLYYLGTLLPEFRRAAQWRATGKRIFLDTIARHVQADGVYFEQSSYYHRYTTDFCLHFLILAGLNDDTPPPSFQERLTLLLDHLMYITKPDGETPLYGDDDGGRLLTLDEAAPTDFRSTLRAGAALFKRGDYKYVGLLESDKGAKEIHESEVAFDRVASVEETAWLLGTEGAAAFDALIGHPPQTESRRFQASGYCVMRDDWTARANYMLIDGGAHGTKGGAHAHADALSFELAACGRTLLVDPGTYTYTKSLELRDAFRGTAAHNTLIVDDESSSLPATAFAWEHVAEIATQKWIAEKRFDLFQGTHDGYMRLSPAPARHTRRILFLKNDYWIIRDSIATTGAHQYDLYFHFAEDCKPVIDNPVGAVRIDSDVVAVRERKTGAAGLDIHTCGVAGVWRCEDGWVSKAYGARSEARVCVFSAKAAGAQEFVSFAVPRAAGAAQTRVRQTEALGGVTCELRSGSDGNAKDVLLAGTGNGSIETACFSSDGEWAWMRFGNEERLPFEFVLIGARYLAIDGAEVWRAEQRAGFFSLRRMAGGRLEIETDAADKWSVALCGAREIMLNGGMFAVEDSEIARFIGGRPASDGNEQELSGQILQETKG